MIRLLRIELRRNALLALLPVFALLWLLTPIARHLQPVALWPDRSVGVQSMVQILCPFTAGVAAWMAYRDRRRALTDLLATTPRNPALRTLAALAATTVWAVLGYLPGATTVLVITARQATWGHPIIWPLLVGLLAVITAGAVGFALGRIAPSRFTAPLAAIGMLGLLALAAQLGELGHIAGWLGPLHPAINMGKSVFFPVRTDLAVLQLMCLAGILVVALAVIVLHTGGRRIGLAGAASGTALVALSVVFIGTAHLDQQDTLVVPAWDSVETLQPLAYTPVCSTSPVPVCLHPAYAAKLSVVDSMVNDVARPLIGMSGLPVRAHQDPAGTMPAVTGPELVIPQLYLQGDTMPAIVAELFQTRVASQLAGVGQPRQRANDRQVPATDAQAAVALYLLNQAGDTADPDLLPATPTVRTAAQRLAALPERNRHAWLSAHIAQVRAGTLTLAEMP